MMNTRKYISPNRDHDRQNFYKYVTTDVAKIILSSRKLRWSSPILFNDPFDVTQDLRLNFNAAELNAALWQRFASIMEHGDSSGAVTHPALAAFVDIGRQLGSDERSSIASELRQSIEDTTQGQIDSLEALKEL